MKAVILVGGEGTRLRPLTYEIPKPMMPVLNRPFMEHTINYLKAHGIGSTILALSYLPETIRDYFGDGGAMGIQVIYAVEDSPLGTAGAVKNVEQYIDSTFVVLNGDIFTDLDIVEMLAFHRNKGAKATISLIQVNNPSAFGVVETNDEGGVQRFIEKPPPGQETTNWINAGIYILEPEVLEHVPPNKHYMFEKGLFPHLLELGEPVYGYPFSGYWIDMGTSEKYLSLNCDILLSKAKSTLIGTLEQNEVRYKKDAIIDPSARIDGPAVIGDGCRINQRVHIKGPVSIGSDCQIGEGARLEETVLLSGVSIGAGASLRQCIIGDNAKIEENDQVSNRVVTATH